jgi:hypothetical protein
MRTEEMTMVMRTEEMTMVMRTEEMTMVMRTEEMEAVKRILEQIRGTDVKRLQQKHKFKGDRFSSLH